MSWKSIINALGAGLIVMLVMIGAGVAGGSISAANAVAFALPVYAVVATGIAASKRSGRKPSGLAVWFASTLGGRMKGQLNLVDTIIDIIISAVILAAMWPALDSALGKLVVAAKNSTNPLIAALSDAIPYLVGLIMLSLLFGLIRWARERAS